MKLPNNRQLLVGAIALSVLILITLVSAPTNAPLRSGSTYSRSPSGYGAWYAFMSERGTPVQRWQRPLGDVRNNSDSEVTPIFDPGSSNLLVTGPITLLRVTSSPTPPSFQEQEWVEQGNVLILLGRQSPATGANFLTFQSSPVGNVKIETRRRNDQSSQEENSQTLLGDDFGAVVWQESLGRGRLISAVTPHLAANAYQNEPGNYKFLAELVTQAGYPVWVDEYIHGYKDRGVTEQSGEPQSWIGYLANTSLAPLLVQVGILLLVLLWGQNRRFGPPLKLAAPAINNSKAYIQALAGVLHKAGSDDFVVATVGKAEQLYVQQALGLGQTLLDPKVVIDTWVQQTGRPAAELAQVLQVRSQKRRISEQDLLIWLGKVQAMRHHLPS